LIAFAPIVLLFCYVHAMNLMNCIDACSNVFCHVVSSRTQLSGSRALLQFR